MRKIVLIFSLIMVFVLGFAFRPLSNNVQGISFYQGTLAEAMAKAKKEKKIIFLDVYAVWCGQCKALKNTTFKDPAVTDYFNNNFINLEINGEEGIGKDIVKKYGLKGYPSLLFIDNNGKLISKSLGYHKGNELLEIARNLK